MMFKILAPWPGAETMMVLPDPEFNDQEALRVEMEIKRTMNGGRRTYVKTANGAKILTFDFRITREKKLELVEFLRLYYADDMRITTHNDETYVVRLTRNPFEFVSAGRHHIGGEQLNVTLEMETVP